MKTYDFPAETPEHVRAVLRLSAYGIRQFGVRYSLEQLNDALEFVLAHPDFVRSPLWNKTKQAALERLIRQRRKLQGAERRWRMSMEA